MMELLGRLFNWTLQEDYRTWIAHACMAALIAIPFGGLAAIVFYGLREVEQIAQEKWGGLPITEQHWLDHGMDWVAAVIGVFLITGLGWARPF